MRLKQLHLENFRCFQNIDIDFNTNKDNNGGITVLVAQNAEGKTTVLDAINIAIGPFLTKLTKNKDRYPISHEDNHRYQNGNIVGYAKIDATFFNPANFVQSTGYNDFHVLRYFDGLKNSTKTEDHYHLTNLAKYIFNWQNNGAPWPLFAYYGDQRLWESLSSKDDYKSMLAQDRLAGYWDARKPAIGYKRCLKWINELSLALFGEQKKKEDGDLSYSQETLDKLQCFMNHIREALRSVMAPSGYSEFNFNVSKNEIEVWGEKHPVRIEASRVSAGIRIVMGMVSDIVYRCCLLNPQLKERILQETPGIVLIDEIELHLHPAWQQQVLPVLQKIFPNIQFIITTHSPQVVSSVPAECIRVIADGKVYTAHGSEGADSARVLEDVFGMMPFPQNNRQRVKLKKYLDLVYDGKWKDSETLKLRAELDEAFRGQEPLLKEADLHIENEEWEAEHPADEKN